MVNVVLVMLVLGAALQHPPKEEPKQPKRGDSVTVRGCLTGSVIESSDSTVRDPGGELHHYVTYRLTGDRKLLEQIRKEHQGHLDVVKGILKSEPPTTTVHSRRIGRTSVYVGVGATSTQRNDPAPAMPVLEVKELEHTEIRCAERR
ncbi:MAG TPA: hypothetical protein VM364_12445 [Vicinamibacterales bacterium]|nr:hypothetical protein [Vicinamibacterales bacterium]